MSADISFFSKKSKVFVNEPLNAHTSLRVGGPAKLLCVPDNREALMEAVSNCMAQDVKFRLIGKGSNLLVSDEGFDGVIIKTTALESLTYRDNRVFVEAGVPLQRLIRFCAQYRLGGIEYLYSVPGNLGGAICMNAGRGERFNLSISDHVVSVKVFDGHNLFHLSREDCRFAYRQSVFQENRHWQILSAEIELPVTEPEVIRKRIRERLSYTRRIQDLSFPNAGTVFKKGFHPFPVLRGYKIGDAMFSEKLDNWILNTGGATSADVLALMTYAEKLHMKRNLPLPVREIEVL